MIKYSELHANKSSGFLTIVFLVVHRFGWNISKLRKAGHKYLLVIYIPLVFLKKILEILFGCSVPFSCQIGSRVIFRHGLHGVFISSDAVIGRDVVIMHQVTIGSNFGSNGIRYAPTIGDNVFIGPGAKIIGNVNIGSNVKIGANALVVDDVDPGTIVVAAKAQKLIKTE